MTLLIVGLVLFIGTHLVRALAPRLRADLIAKLGEGKFKGLYSLAALAGFGLIVYGYGEARTEPVVLWALPVAVRHTSSLLLLVAMILLAASYVPGNRIKAAVGHPMMVGTGVWAFAHLLANGMVADLALFGSFLLWILVAYPAARRRDRAQGVEHVRLGVGRDLAAIAVGLAMWCGFAFYLHAKLFGVSPFG